MGNPTIPSATPPMTVSVEFVHAILFGLVSKGIDCDAWLLEAGIPPEQLANPAARVTLSQYAALLHVLIFSRDDETLGLMRRPSKVGSFALQARSAIGSPTLDVAIRRVAHTFRLLHDDVELVVVEEGELSGVALNISDPTTRANRFLHQLFLRVYWRLFAWLVGGQLPPVRFDFAFPRPPHSEDYSRIFPAPWAYDADSSAVWFEHSRLRLPIRRDETALRAFLVDSPANVLVPSRDTGVGSRVRMHLQRTQPDWPDLDVTARALNLSPSTLQRRLALEGTSFQKLKDQLRRDAAIYRLHSSEVSLGKLALELGFADAAAFQRAFKGWTGLPPGTYRRSS
jgi:AraC-like DNA-binding protein